jgi:hypothetical protein
MNINKASTLLLALPLLLSEFSRPAQAWDHFGHMAVAYVAYKRLTPQKQQRALALIHLNPRFQAWQQALPPNASAGDKDLMLFMLAATWPDEIKSDAHFVSDGSENGNRPEGSPNAAANDGYGDTSRHKYWHFIDTPFATDGTSLPLIPNPNAQERIALFRGVLASTAPDPVKSYDLVWLLHLVGDVHQPLHCTTRVDNQYPNGDNGGNLVKLNCSDCSGELHAFWDNLLGKGQNTNIVINVIQVAKRLQHADSVLAANLDEKEWIAEGFQTAQETVYKKLPAPNAEGVFSLNATYQRGAKVLARKRVALAGARLANLLNAELQ